MQDRIEKTIELAAPVSRVWHALTDHTEFGQWFRVDLEGPFVVGQLCRGSMTYPGYEGMKWEATVQAMEPESLFSFTWCPYGEDPDIDHSKEPQTLVEFRLEPTSDGTRLTITETGFSTLSDAFREDALRNNTEGWNKQAENLTAHVES